MGIVLRGYYIPGIIVCTICRNIYQVPGININSMHVHCRDGMFQSEVQVLMSVAQVYNIPGTWYTYVSNTS